MKSEQLETLLAPVIASIGLELLGLEYAPHRTSALLRIYIDAPERVVTIDDCEAASREISATLDVHDPITSHYTLEVSSPGLDRPLFKPAHFARFVGEPAKVSVHVPVGTRRRFQGPIVSVDGNTIVINQDGVDVAIGHDNIEKARLVPVFPEPNDGRAKPGSKPGGKKGAADKPAPAKAAAPKKNPKAK